VTPSPIAPPTCTCSQLPHVADCPVAPFFDRADAITLWSDEQEQEHPFIIVCPRGCKYLQTEHAAGYDYTPTNGQTDKEFMPTIVGHDPSEEEDDVPFKILCPNTSCRAEYDRTDGNLEIWLERNVLQGVHEAKVRGIYFRKGQIVEEYTSLSIECYSCGHSYGESPE
jgi:hypothetical protein